MADIPASAWSETAASNTSAAPDGWPANSSPLIVYSTDREMMGAIKREWNRQNATVTGSASATAMTLTYTTAPAAYVQGMRFTFIAGATNTGTCTLNVNGLGAKSIFADNKALAGGEIQSGCLVEVQYDNTQFQILSRQPAISLPNGFRNVVVNGDFQVQQRGAGGSLNVAVAASTTAYTFDRWYIITGANQACHVQSTAGNGTARYQAVVIRDSGQTGTGGLVFIHAFTTDELAPLLGKIVTLSFRASTGATWSPTSGTFSASFFVGTGTEGKRGAGFTSETTVLTQSNNLAAGSSVTNYTVTSSAVVPTTSTQGAIVFSWTPVGTAGATDQILFGDVQLEVGGIATAFDRRPFGDELARCQRFYQKNFTYVTAPAQSAGQGYTTVFLPTGVSGTFGLSIPLNPPLRGTPVTATTYNPSAANANWRDIGNAADRTVTVGVSSTAGLYLQGASGVAASTNAINWAVDADL